mgnify:CR=1 FL=1
MRTMRLRSIPVSSSRSRDAAERVDLRSNGFNMRRAHTRSVAAKMIGEFIGRHRPIDKSIQGTVSLEPLADTVHDGGSLSISVFVGCAEPRPAWAKFGSMNWNRAVLVNVLPDSVLKWYGRPAHRSSGSPLRIASFNPSGVGLLLAPSICSSPSVAVTAHAAPPNKVTTDIIS